MKDLPEALQQLISTLVLEQPFVEKTPRMTMYHIRKSIQKFLADTQLDEKMNPSMPSGGGVVVARDRDTPSKARGGLSGTEALKAKDRRIEWLETDVKEQIRIARWWRNKWTALSKASGAKVREIDSLTDKLGKSEALVKWLRSSVAKAREDASYWHSWGTALFKASEAKDREVKSLTGKLKGANANLKISQEATGYWKEKCSSLEKANKKAQEQADRDFDDVKAFWEKKYSSLSTGLEQTKLTLAAYRQLWSLFVRPFIRGD